MNHLYIAGTIIFTVYGQLILKWRIGFYDALPSAPLEKVFFLFKLLLDPYIISGFIAAFIASLCWMAAMTKFEISYAYPFMSLNFVFVLFLSTLLLNESLSLARIAGISLIIIGTIIAART
ncbi:MAG: EamA family transporter [gamma proteobacterium symbiont of Bathyaustriella thionipta]|nr:EamA family transporter [gamma proteobacterium symbiont of Bathyaustriella thionipta]